MMVSSEASSAPAIRVGGGRRHVSVSCDGWRQDCRRSSVVCAVASQVAISNGLEAVVGRARGCYADIQDILVATARRHEQS
jgi:hypothetical protein